VCQASEECLAETDIQHSPHIEGGAVINIFRMEDGKFAEHWNVGQAVPKTSKNNNTMF